MNHAAGRVIPLLVGCLFFLINCDRGDQASSPETTPAQQAKTAAAPPAPPLPLVVAKEMETRVIQPGFEYPATIEAVETAAMRP